MTSLAASACLHALREALSLAVLIAAPPLLAAGAAGLVMSFIQAATRIEERTLQVVPRLLAAVVALAVCGPWIGAQLVRFTVAILEAVPAIGRS